MKTHHSSQVTRGASASRPDHLSETSSPDGQASPAASRPLLGGIDFAARRRNRALPAEQLIHLLRNAAPQFFALAEVVGKWVWIQFPDKQPREVTRQLAEFGFHWNNKRQAWQHPCGPAGSESSPDDPRAKYGSLFPADTLPA